MGTDPALLARLLCRRFHSLGPSPALGQHLDLAGKERAEGQGQGQCQGTDASKGPVLQQVAARELGNFEFSFGKD